MNSYKNPVHEKLLKTWLADRGFNFLSLSSELNPFIKIFPRCQTSVVNACLDPVLSTYLNEVNDYLDEGNLHVMTSAGGLETARNFHPKDSLLSGPAGGVVGAAAVGGACGFRKIISFDMGGTSTDVSRYDGSFDYVFEHRVGDATLSAPALSIETVAAGGGSICSFDGFKLAVGPESAGAFPGPACYGAGGPLTITDVNLLLGRLDPENFSIPVQPEQAERVFSELMEKLRSAGEEPDETRILEGFLAIANERMADAIRKISMKKGYDPAEYALVTFGGAGGQHACAIADQLGITTVLVPDNAGLLSAYGLGNAAFEKFADQQYLEPLDQLKPELKKHIDHLERRAKKKLEKEGIDPDSIRIRSRRIFMRFEGQESTLEIEYGNDEPDPEEKFRAAYREQYGHWIEGRTIEVESMRVIASSQYDVPAPETKEAAKGKPEPVREKTVRFGGDNPETPVYPRETCRPGQRIRGPALILDPYSTIVLEPGWRSEVQPDMTLKMERVGHTDQSTGTAINQASEAVALELFTNRFSSIAEEMGEMLRRTAISVNIKERLDFSCALLNADGELIVNAPHIPVHLGALGDCVRKLKETITMNPGDVVVTNHPAFGGSHLPDVTVVTPVFTGNRKLAGFAASRAHHAEIGGTRPGSMPPNATSLAEEGVVIDPDYLVKEYEPRWDMIQDLLREAPHPTRNLQENIADLQAAVAANHRGVKSFSKLVETHGFKTISHYMDALKQYAADKMRSTLNKLANGTYHTTEYLDDGTKLNATLEVDEERISIDFTGTDQPHPGNLNATPAIVNSVVIYVLRTLIDEPLPLNEGLLEPVDIILPRCLLNPEFPPEPEKCPAVVGGNVETSQRLVDLLLKPFGLVACSQGTMNNVLFGNESFGYYETIGGGTGAGPDFDGCDAVHHHMTNTAGTDPEILEHRYPVRLDSYRIRRNSGGDGKHRGGNGIQREMTFLEPVRLSVLTQHRETRPYGLKSGDPGKPGRQWIERKNGGKEMLDSIDGSDLQPGDRFVIQTPGGGGYGK